MTRAMISAAVILGAVAIVAADLGASEPLNPFRAPPLLALGSGQAASGAHCAAPAR
ncbi:MAG: hypothetical protein ACK4GW_15210 [Pseudorhodobacter sp.]